MTKPNLHFFYGEDTYSAWHKSQFWKREFEKKHGDFNVVSLEGESMTAADFREAVDSVPFLGEKKLIIVRDFLRHARAAKDDDDDKEDDQKSVAKKLDTLNDFCVVLFLETGKPDARTTLFKTLKKHAVMVAFDPIVGPQLCNWIQQKVQARNGQIGLREANILAETVGPNLWQMTQEIEKLTTFAEGKPIPTEAIENLVSPNLAANIFKFTDQLGARNAKAALKTLNILLESGSEIVGTLFMIVRQFRIMIQIEACMRQKMDKSTITQKLKLHPFVVSNTMGQAKNFDAAKLKKIYSRLLAIDEGMKTGSQKGKISITTTDTTELRLAMEKLIVELCVR